MRTNFDGFREVGHGSVQVAISLFCDGAIEVGHLVLRTEIDAYGVIRDSSIKKGYICLESEGSPIEFKNLRIRVLP